MQIKWKITREKRGNWRPLLEIEMKRDKWEAELNIPRVSMPTPFPCAYNHFELNKIYKDFEPKSWERFESISSPLPVQELVKSWFALPVKPDAKTEYPEVEIILRAFARKYERALMEAYDAAPFETGGTLEMSDKCKRHVAPGVTAKRMLRVVNG